jgi:PAS domain S-box-containing protein
VVTGAENLDSSEKKAALKQTIKIKNRKLAEANKRLRSEIERNALTQKQLQDRLNFEKLLADISASFISVSAGLLERELKTAQQKLCEFLGVDFSGLWKLSGEKGDSLKLIHYYRSPDIAPDFPPPSEGLEAKEFFPWALKRLLKGEIAIMARAVDDPALTARDLEILQYFGAKSIVTFPLSVGDGKTLGALGFTFIRREMDWPAEMVGRLHLAADIFASAIARQAAADALHDSEERVSLALDSAEAGLWSIDFKTGVIWVTARTRELYGFSADEEITRDTYQKAMHPDDRDRVNRTVNRPFQGDTDFPIELRVVLPDGRIRWIKARGKGYYGSSGVLERLTGVSLDISQRKQAETEAAQLRIELAHLGRITMMNEISSALAHEINQPLGAILNNASAASLLMSQGKNSPGEINEIIDDIIRDARRAGDVVRKIRGIVKASDVHFERMDINTLIAATVELVSSRLNIGKILLRLELQQGIEDVKGDHVRLQQVILNLIYNAIDAMADMPDRKLTIRSHMEGPDTVIISVTDMGKGFDNEVAKKLFKPFFTTKKDGLGMGLRICRSIIEEHGGRIVAENNTDGGATVSFSLRTWQGEPA